MKDKSYIYLTENFDIYETDSEELKKYSPSSVKKRFNAEKKEYILQADKCKAVYRKMSVAKIRHETVKTVPAQQNYNPNNNYNPPRNYSPKNNYSQSQNYNPQSQAFYGNTPTYNNNNFPKKKRSKVPLVVLPLLVAVGLLGTFGYIYFFNPDMLVNNDDHILAQNNNDDTKLMFTTKPPVQTNQVHTTEVLSPVTETATVTATSSVGSIIWIADTVTANAGEEVKVNIVVNDQKDSGLSVSGAEAVVSFPDEIELTAITGSEAYDTEIENDLRQ